MHTPAVWRSGLHGWSVRVRDEGGHRAIKAQAHHRDARAVAGDEGRGDAVTGEAVAPESPAIVDAGEDERATVERELQRAEAEGVERGQAPEAGAVGVAAPDGAGVGLRVGPVAEAVMQVEHDARSAPDKIQDAAVARPQGQFAGRNGADA